MKPIPRVTVITPFLNAETYLGEAIRSVQQQTIPDWEMILIDDGSTDNSRAIAEKTAKLDDRITIIDNTSGLNRGPAAARNLGMKTGKGHFIAFLDADDLYKPQMLETYLNAMHANPAAAMVFGPTKWWHPNGERPDWIEHMQGVAGKMHFPHQILRRVFLMQDGHVPCTCSILARRDAVEIVGGFEASFSLYEDQTLWSKLLLRFPVYVTPACLSLYRQHAASASAKATSEGLYDRLGEHLARKDYLEWLAKYVEASKISNAGLDRAIRLALSPYVSPPTMRSKYDRLVLRTTILLTRQRRKFLRRVLSFAGLTGGSARS
jgi:glycosyltransferase involved in cell wall biosynthesis